MSFLTINSLRKSYGRNTPVVIDDLSLDVEKGEIVCILGESGSGKTTLLRLIAGFEVPDHGEIAIDEEKLSGTGVFRPPEIRGISMVFQGNSLFPHLTVRRNIAYGLHPFGAAERVERLRDILELTGLEDLAERYPHELSGGQQQRVSVARALAPRPAVLLLDEPFSNLDNVGSRQIRDDIVKLIRQTHTTTLLVTHDTADALAVADRIGVVNDGTLLQIGSPREVYESPRTRFVAELFGASNFLDARRADKGVSIEIGELPIDPSRLGSAETVTVSIRPEHIQIVDAGEDAIRGRVVDAGFHGPFQVLLVAVAGATGPAGEIRLHHFGTTTYKVGDELHFIVPPEKIHVLDAE